MPIASSVKLLLKEFEKENPKAKGKAKLGSGTRTVDDQIQIILQPKRKNNYLNIKKRFKKKFTLETLPLYKDLTTDQDKWWKTEVKKQAGKPDGFAHVGGKAQDVKGVNGLTKEQKTKLKEKFETKFSVLMEKVSGTTSKYNVPLTDANVFHVYKK